MRLLDAREGYPANTASGGCYIRGCTNGDAPRVENTYVVDLETDIEMEGHLVICEDCAEVMAGLLGMTSDSETKRLRGRIRNLEDQTVQLEMELQGVTDRVKQAVG